MSRIEVDIDEDACRMVMERFGLTSMGDAVNLALRCVAGQPLDLDEARRARGTGWDDDLDEIRASRNF